MVPRSRRDFLRFLAGSPLFAYLGWPRSEQNGGVPDAGPIASPAEALNVFDFEVVAREKLPPAHFGYLATGVDDDLTLRANREAFSKFQLRVRRLVDVSKLDLSTELFGTRWETPIVLAPAGSQQAFHPEGELAVARAAKARGHLQILSTVSTTSVEDVAAARGAPIWYQLYTTSQWRVTERLLRRAEDAECPVVALTVDLLAGSNRETVERFARVDTRECSVCHEPGVQGMLRRKPMFDGLDLADLEFDTPSMTWDFVRRLRESTRMKLVLKGIVTHEDARLCLENGVDGIIISNHGGRAEASGRATLDCLPEIVDAVGGKIPILIDGGFRRGTDVFKALAMGARAVCIGRPYLWGLAAFGQEGVERVLEILRAELELVMAQAGVSSLDKINSNYIVRSS